VRKGNPRDDGDDEEFESDLPEDDSSSDFDTLVQDLRGDVRGLGRSLHRAVSIEWLRFKTLAVDGAVKWALFLLIFGFFLAIFISAGAFVAQGVRDHLGNFAAGFGILGVILVFGLVLRSVMRKQGVRSVKRAFRRRHEEDEDGSDES
jgi:hypothetical protein